MDVKTARQRAKAELEAGQNRGKGELLKQIILGGQDGLVNVLGVLLGVASATSQTGIVIVAGLAAAFAESVSMAAVAYTSARAGQDYYFSQRRNEEREMEVVPEVEREEVRLIFMKKGFRGKQLDGLVRKVTSDKKAWLEIMMTEELGLPAQAELEDPVRAAIVVGVSAIVGSFVPLIPFFFLPIGHAMVASLVLSTIVLFAVGVVKAKITVGSWLKSGVEMAVIGMLAALVGYAVGALVGAGSGTG